MISFPPQELQQIGPIIRVIIGHPKDDFIEATSVGFEIPEQRPVRALIDTGAAVTIINPELAETYKLRYTGPARITAAGHTGDYREFAASISFPDVRVRSFDIQRIVACPLNRGEMSCLIGRDILRYWEFSYNGSSGNIRIRDLRA